MRVSSVSSQLWVSHGSNANTEKLLVLGAPLDSWKSLSDILLLTLLQIIIPATFKRIFSRSISWLEQGRHAKVSLSRGFKWSFIGEQNSGSGGGEGHGPLRWWRRRGRLLNSLQLRAVVWLFILHDEVAKVLKCLPPLPVPLIWPN